MWAQATGLEESANALLMLNGSHPALIWWTFILVGMAVGRSDLASPRMRAPLLAAGAALSVLGYGAGRMTTRRWSASGLRQDAVPAARLSPHMCAPDR